MYVFVKLVTWISFLYQIVDFVTFCFCTFLPQEKNIKLNSIIAKHATCVQNLTRSSIPFFHSILWILCLLYWTL